MIDSYNIYWVFVTSWSLKLKHVVIARDDKLFIQRETITKKNKHGYANGESRTYYFIDNDTREFKTEEELIQALNCKSSIDLENEKS